MPRDFDYIPEDTKPVTKPDVFSLEGLAAWLETQDPRKSYSYCDTGACLLHQYFSAAGVPVDLVGGYTWDDTHGREHDLSVNFRYVSREYPHDMAAALSRCRTAMEG